MAEFTYNPDPVQLCQQEIDALEAQNANLQFQMNLANLYAFQRAQTVALERRLNLKPIPIPAYAVVNQYKMA